MVEEAANGWVFRFHSLLDSTNFLSFAPNLRNHELRVTNSEFLVGFLILFWATLYLFYEKFLHRSRIIDAVWACGFCFGSICYLKLSAKPASDLSSHNQWGLGRLELGLILHKSYYFHRSGVEVFSHGAWLKGWADLLFALLFGNFNQQTWCPAVTGLLFYKAVDSLTLDICRILLSVSQAKLAKFATKLVFLFHCLNWIYMYVLFVPDSILWPDNIIIIRSGGLYLWMWFLSECWVSVWMKLFFYINTNDWLEACLFPPPTEEAIQLAIIRKRQRDSLRQNSNTSTVPKKTELWHTLLCAMAIKKKIKRMRQARSNNPGTSKKAREDEKKGAIADNGEMDEMFSSQ